MHISDSHVMVEYSNLEINKRRNNYKLLLHAYCN